MVNLLILIIAIAMIYLSTKEIRRSDLKGRLKGYISLAIGIATILTVIYITLTKEKY
jgi:hypothetical protein